MSGQAARHGPGPAVWLQGLVCGAIVALATPCAVMAGLLLAPGIGALLLDREPGRPAAKVVLLCGAAMAMSPLFALWESGQSVSGAITASADMMLLGGCWAAQGAGWLMVVLTPVFVRLALEAHAQATILRLRAERSRYEAEWGIPPAEPPNPQP